MESKICENCSTPVFQKQIYFECDNSHITCSKCLVKIFKECPFCKADWKTISSKKNEKNEITIKISPETEYNLDCLDCSSTINCDGNLIDDSLKNRELIIKVSLSPNGAQVKGSRDSGHIKAKLSTPASGQFDSNKIYNLKFANEKERKIFETMNSFSSEKQKLQVINTKSSKNHLPNRSPSHANKININFNELSSNEVQHFSPYQASPSTKPKNIRRQELSILSTDLENSIRASETGPRRLKRTKKVVSLLLQQGNLETNEPKNKKSNENVFMVSGQPQGKERSLHVPSNKDVYIRNFCFITPVKVLNKKINTCSKMMRVRREQLIAEEKTMIRQRILQHMKQKLLEQNYQMSNTSPFPVGQKYAGSSFKGEDIKHKLFRKFNKTRAKRNFEVKLNSNSSTSEFKSFYSEKPSSDMNLKKKNFPRILNKELNLNVDTPKNFPRPSFKLLYQRKHNEKAELLKKINSKCDPILDTKTSLRIKSSTEPPHCEVTVLSPTSEKSYDKYGLSRTVHHNYKDSSTEPIPSCYFESHKLCCPCSCDKICNNKRVLNEFSKSEIGNISQKNSSYDVKTNKFKSNTNIKKKLQKHPIILH